MRMSRTTRKKKASFTGMGKVAEYVLILVILAIMLYIIYSLLWEKTIKGGIFGIMEETQTQTDNATKSLSDLTGGVTGGDPVGGENGNQGAPT